MDGLCSYINGWVERILVDYSGFKQIRKKGNRFDVWVGGASEKMRVCYISFAVDGHTAAHGFLTKAFENSDFHGNYILEVLKHIDDDIDRQIRYGDYIEIKDVIFNDPATIVFWKDGSKTIVKCQEGDTFDPEKGLAMAIVKRCYGDKSKFNDIFKKWMPKGE